MNKLIFPALAVVLVVSGCAVGPDYRRPEVALPEEYNAFQPEAAAGEEHVNPEWWRLFGDAELDRLVELTFANNQDLVAASARMEAAEAAAREARAGYFPGVDASGSASRTRTSGATLSGMQTGSVIVPDRQAALSVGYELDIWGRIRRQNEAARAQALSSRYARDALRISLAGMVTSDYLTLRMLDAELDAAMDTLASWLKTERIMRARFDAGLSAEIDLKQTIAAYAAAHAQWVELKRQRDLMENRLGLLAGQPGLMIARSLERGMQRNREIFQRIPSPPIPPLGLPSSLLEARPDVRQAEEALVAANAQIGVARAAYFPTIGLTGLLGSESAEFSDLFTAPARIWSYGAALTMPIFNAGRTGARVDQASAHQREALANYRKSIQTAFTEVRDALANLNYYRRVVESLEIQVNAARDTERLAMARYEEGYSSFLEPLDSRRTLSNAELSYLTAHRNRLAATVDLFKALGGGWQKNPQKAHRKEVAKEEPTDTEESGEEEPNEAASNEAEPNEAEPNEAEPDAVTSNEAEPNEVAPNEAEPNVAEPNEVEPNEAEPYEITPYEVMPDRVAPYGEEALQLELIGGLGD
ncbi:MAG: efflux transporter outer membrane subunit [Zoogloeaceae bacterium]|nr:efflux transporter outer membrane subunit [Zoogloeaceae bacterium]